MLEDGFNRLPTGEEIFFVSNPGLGLWALRDNFSPGVSGLGPAISRNPANTALIAGDQGRK
jgi:hypothetical protein